MFDCVEYETARYNTKSECLRELSTFLNSLEDDSTRITVIDIEKDFSVDICLADYKPRLFLKAVVTYKEEVIES